MFVKQGSKKNKYVRPAQAENYLQLSQVATGPIDDSSQMLLTVPDIPYIRPTMWYNHYEEATSAGVDARSRIVCSGSIIPIPSGADPTSAPLGVAILKEDTKPGHQMDCYTSGRFLLPFFTDSNTGYLNTDFLGDVSRDVKGKTAYYSPVTGFVDTATAVTKCVAGIFTGYVQFQPQHNVAGFVYAEVEISNIPGKAAASVGISPTAFSGYSPTSMLNVQVSEFVGLKQNVSIMAAINDPNEPVLPEHVEVVYAGTNYPVDNNYNAFVTFAAGVEVQFGIVISKTLRDGTAFEEYFNFLIDIDSSNAPDNLVVE